jgi:CPA2 family monovalent cation:H+ antiporter-2
MESLIPILILTVGLATGINLLLRRFNMPTVIGYIFTGAIIKAIFEIDLHSEAGLENLAEFGVVFLMFTIGLEFSPAHLLKMRRQVFLFGALQVIVTTAAIALIIQFLGLVDFKVGLIIAAGLALSSTAIVLKILNESGKIKSEMGSNTVGILIFQDLAVIPIMVMITVFSDLEKSLGELVLSTVVNALIALFLLVGLGKLLFHRLFKAVSGTNSKEIYMGSILLTLVGASYIAHHFGFSYSLGGFIAGMMISETIYKYQVEADLIPFRDLLLGVFFVSVGLQIDFGMVMAHLPEIAALVAGVMLVKMACAFFILKKASDGKTAFKSALAIAQVGEFALVVFSMLLDNGMLDPVSVQILMVMTIVSMISTPFLINQMDAIAGLLFKENIEEKALDQASTVGGHVILCGYGEFGRVVSEQLDASDINHVVVTNNTDAYVKAGEAGKSVIFGDPSDRTLLENLRIREAMATILALDDFEEVRRASAAIALIDPELKVIAKVLSKGEIEVLKTFNHEILLDGNSHTASFIVGQLNKSRLLAKETLTLQHLSDYALDRPDEAIHKIKCEQARLLHIMSGSFNALREGKDVMKIKAFYDSFKVLSEIIGSAIADIMKHANLNPMQYERISVLLDNQEHLVAMNDALEGLGRELKQLDVHERLGPISHAAVEGLDAILLTLIDLAKDYDADDMRALEGMTSGGGQGLSKVREKYLAAGESDLDADAKSTLLSSTLHVERLRSLFGMVAGNYRKLEEAG